MSEDYTVRDNCRLCASSHLEKVVELPPTIPGEHLTTNAKEESTLLIPIDLWQCEDCSHVQLLTIPNPRILFNELYTFMPSDNPKIIKHFSKSIDYFLSKFNPTVSFAFEVGSNDGLYLDLLRNKTGCKTLGIDPAHPAVEVAREKGIDTIHEFFAAGSEELVLKNYSQPDLIVANNVFAHIDDLRGVTRSISNLLKDEGYFIFEASYLLDIVKKNLIGTIIHEHLSHHSIFSLAPFLKSYGLELIDVKCYKEIQGGAIIGIAKKTESSNSNGKMDKIIKGEQEAGITTIDGMIRFNKRLHARLERFKNEILSSFKEKEIICFGAARSAPFILQLLEIGDKISFAIDDNPIKVGKFLPISKTPIYSSEYLESFPPSSNINFLITGWAQTERILVHLRSRFSGYALCIYPNFEIMKL